MPTDPTPDAVTEAVRAWEAWASEVCACKPFVYYGVAEPGSFDEDCPLHGRASAPIAALTAERERLQAALGGGEALQGAPIPDHGIEGITPEMVDELLAERPPSGDDVEGRA